MIFSLHRYLAAFFAAASLITLTAAIPDLVPSRRQDVLYKRGPWSELISPKDTVRLHYAPAPHYPPTAVVTFTAVPGQPILLLEDIDHLLNDVSCASNEENNEATIVIHFVTSDAFQAATDSWTAFNELVVLTAHSSCNSRHERGAWRTTSARTDPISMSITLVAEVIQMRDVGRSFGIRYDHSGGTNWSSRERVMKRGEYDFDDVFPYDYKPDIPARLALFPPNGTVDDSVPQTVLQQLTDAEVNLTCVDCGLQANVSIGLDFQVDIGDASCIVSSSESCFTLSHAAMNLTILELNQTAALEVFIAKTLSADANYKVLQVPVAPGLKIPDLVDIIPSVGLEITFGLEVPVSINFTYGATGHIANGAFASVSLINSTGEWDPTTVATGWDRSGVDQIPFRVNDGELNVTASVSLAPYAEVEFEILDVGAALRLSQNVPKASVTSSLRVSVNRQCESIGPDDFESFQTAFLVGADLDLSCTASLVLEKGAFSGQGIPDSWDFSLWDHDFSLAPTLGLNKSSCFILSNDTLNANTTANHTQQPDASPLVGLPAAAGTLYPAASAVPTFDIPKIESYYSANGHLPTNVNYEQMVQATTVPDDIKAAVTSAAATQQASQQSSQSSASFPRAYVGWQALLIPCGVVAGAVLL